MWVSVPRVIKAVPLRTEAIHFCFDSLLWETFFSFFKISLNLFSQMRTRSHYGEFSISLSPELLVLKFYLNLCIATLLGSRVECMFELMSYGIPTDSFPLAADGSIDKKFHLQYWEKRRLQERNTRKTVQVTGVPSRYDVLFGTGRTVLMHIGNVRYRKLIEDCYDTYETSTYSQRKQITEEILDIIRASGGRFLKDDGMGWCEVDEAVARQKVSNAFRSVRKAHNKEESAMSDSLGSNSRSSLSAPPTRRRMKRD